MSRNLEQNALAGRLMRLYSLTVSKDENFRRRLSILLDLFEKEADFIDIFFKNEEVADMLKKKIDEIFLEKPRGQICVVGVSTIEIPQIYGISKELGIPDPKRHLELHLGYEAIKKNVHFEKLRHNENYLGLIIGPMPHKVEDLGGYESINQMMIEEGGYPPFAMAVTENEGTHLKMTKSSFKRALEELLLKICY